MNILTYPKHVKALREVAQPVTKEMIASEDFQKKLAEMKEIAKKDGIGLAATQIGWNVQLFMLLVNRHLEKLEEPIVVINPKITFESKETAKVEEGCLSFPDLELKVIRPAEIEWEAENLDGEKNSARELFTRGLSEGYFIRVIQHETDHLNGKLMIDHISPAERLKFDRWMKDRPQD